MMSTMSTSCVVRSSEHTAMRESSLANLWQNHSTPSCELADITVNHFAIQQAQSAMTSIKQPTPVTMTMVTHHLHPPRTAPIAHNSTQPAEQIAPHGTPVTPNATRLDTGDQNAMVASLLNQRMHLCQGMHPQMGHSMGSPDAHIGATTTTLAGVVKQMP